MAKMAESEITEWMAFCELEQEDEQAAIEEARTKGNT